MKKTTPQNLSKRLSQYGALTAAMTGVANANGQVNFTPVNIIDATAYQLDVDNNATPEFKFSQTASSLRVLPNFPSAAILGSSSPLYGYVYPFALSTGATISNAQTSWFYGDGYYQSMNYSNCLNGNWCDPTVDKYLGLRFMISGQTHYGWARISVFNLPGAGDYPNSGWAITGYAYEETANASIVAGDEGTLGLDDKSFAKTVKVVALNKSIGLYNLQESTNYKLYSLSGQAILEGKTNQSSFVIEANTVATGIYVVEVMDVASKGVLRKKIVL